MQQTVLQQSNLIQAAVYDVKIQSRYFTSGLTVRIILGSVHIIAICGSQPLPSLRVRYIMVRTKICMDFNVWAKLM